MPRKLYSSKYHCGELVEILAPAIFKGTFGIVIENTSAKWGAADPNTVYCVYSIEGQNYKELCNFELKKVGDV
jgi:hypothetical protein